MKIYTRSSFGKGYVLTDVYDVRQTSGRDLKHLSLITHLDVYKRQVEVLVLVNQSDKTVSVLFVLLVALDSLFQNRDFSGRCV